MNIAMIGCGYVAESYLATLPAHSELKLIGVYDWQPERLAHFSSTYKLHAYQTQQEMLDDKRVDMVLNLTNPRSHYDISKAALESGKHVYSEKPLAMDIDNAKALVALANSKDLLMVSAPCGLLGETAQTVWRALRENAVGTVRLVYADMDDGMLHLSGYEHWLSKSGIPWPAKDEFEVGCTIEHSGYYLAWLVGFFGPAVSVTSFASIQVDDKLVEDPLNMQSADFSVACIQFANGVVARLTCSILAPHDRSLRIIGDGGVLYTDECWDYQSAVYSRKLSKIRHKTFLNPIKTRHPLAEAPYPQLKKARRQLAMDFSRGPAEMADALNSKRRCRLSNEYSLHFNEISLAIHNAREPGARVYEMTTTFDPIEPMPWAQDGDSPLLPTSAGATKVRWGILGTGTIANHFAGDFSHSHHACLHAVSSRTLDNAEQFAQRHGAVQAYGSYDAMLADEDVDVVYIATPHFRHKQDCLAAFAAGKSVLCEKPLALNAIEARTIINAAKTHNVFCMEAMWMRCMPMLEKVRQHIRNGDIGTVKSIRAEFGYPTEFSPDNRFFNLAQSGGSLLDRGIYPIALAYHLLGKPIETNGEAVIGETGVDESSCYRLKFDGGATAELCSSLKAYASNEAIISGSDGWIRIYAPFYRPEHISVHKGQAPTAPSVCAACDGFKTNKVTQKVKRMTNKVAHKFRSGQHTTSRIPGRGYQFEIDEVSRCVQQNLAEGTLVPLEDSLAILEIMDELRAQWGLKYPQEHGA